MAKSSNFSKKLRLLGYLRVKRYSLPSLMENPDLRATVTDFTTILESIDYSKFEKSSNVADEIPTKLLSSFLECELPVVVPDQYDLKFSIKAVERKRWEEDSTHKEIEIIGNQNFPKTFQIYLGNSNNKSNLVKYLFQKQR